MPIRRPRTPPPALRHVVLLETMAAHAPTDARVRAMHAVLLALRLVDHWATLGTAVTMPGARALTATRAEIDLLDLDPMLRASLAALIDAMLALPAPDVQPVLPRLVALGSLLERRHYLAEAGDVFRTVSRYADPVSNLDLAFESHMRTGDCLRAVHEYEWADQAYAQASMLATRDRDPDRVERARRARSAVLATRTVEHAR
jgi:hypothetical protein